MKVLIVEDNPGIADLIKKVVKILEFQPFVFDNAIDALDFYKENFCEIIITELL